MAVVADELPVQRRAACLPRTTFCLGSWGDACSQKLVYWCAQGFKPRTGRDPHSLAEMLS